MSTKRCGTVNEATRVCYIHVGTHKTGTTSIQRFLALNRERFAAAGVFFPTAGCDNGPEYVSHHQLAYELTASPNFKPQYGGLDAVAEELKHCDARVACLSSENFSFLWHNSFGLVRLRDTVLNAGFTPKIVCYLRPQASYCSSVYAQIVCNGDYRTPFSEYLNDTLTRGHYVRGSSTGTPFDYERLIDPFADVFGRESIIVRRYRSTAADKALLFEFGRLLTSEDIVDFAIPKLRENGSLDFNTVLTFLGHRQATKIRIRFAPLNLRQVFRFGSRFRTANAAIAARYAVRLPAFEFIDIALASPFRRTVGKARELALARRALRRTRTTNAAGWCGARNTCYLHIGTHKTGTTTLQRVLGANDPLFADTGVYVPRAGRTDDANAHHNIAWELNEDERFDATRGTLADALEEIAREQAPRVCLSSEDFEYLHARPQALRTLADGLNGIGYRPVVIVYLRPQAGYAESLYAELVGHGLAVSFDQFLDAVIETGGYRFNERWRFTFDYERLLDDFAAVFGPGQIIVRRYEAGANDIVRDFLPLIGAGDRDSSAPVSSTRRLNTELRCADVLRLLENSVRSGRTLDGPAMASRMALPAGRFDPVHLNEVRRIVDRFNAGNKRVYEKYGALIPCVSGRDLVADVAAAVGVDPASRYRKRRVQAHARELGTADSGTPKSPRRPPPALARQDERIFAPHLARPAQLEALIAVTAAVVAWASLAYGARMASTALIEFGMLSIIVAVSAAASLIRYAVESRGIIADYQFFDDWGARFNVFGYALVGLYAVVNALLDIGLARYQPDWISYPGTVATAAAALIVSVVQPLRKRLLGGISSSPIFAGMSDDRVYLACCYVALFGQVIHAIGPDWRLDTAIDLLVVVLVGSKVYHFWRLLDVNNPRVAV